MTRFGKLVLMGVLAGTLGLVGCSSDDGGSGGGTGGTPGTGGMGGSGGTPSTGGTGGTPPNVEACGAGQEIDGSYATSTGSVSCDALGVIHGLRTKKDLDEAASAYKDISTVMANQEDLVDIAVGLRPLAVMKG